MNWLPCEDCPNAHDCALNNYGCLKPNPPIHVLQSKLEELRIEIEARKGVTQHEVIHKRNDKRTFL